MHSGFLDPCFSSWLVFVHVSQRYDSNPGSAKVVFEFGSADQNQLSGVPVPTDLGGDEVGAGGHRISTVIPSVPDKKMPPGAEQSSVLTPNSFTGGAEEIDPNRPWFLQLE